MSAFTLAGGHRKVEKNNWYQNYIYSSKWLKVSDTFLFVGQWNTRKVFLFSSTFVFTSYLRWVDEFNHFTFRKRSVFISFNLIRGHDSHQYIHDESVNSPKRRVNDRKEQHVAYVGCCRGRWRIDGDECSVVFSANVFVVNACTRPTNLNYCSYNTEIHGHLGERSDNYITLRPVRFFV